MARILQLTDLHVVAEGALASGVLDTRGILDTAIDRLIDLRPALGPLDAVLVTGDISDDGSPESYDLARSELERLALPVLVIPGNHDCREALRAAFRHLDQMPERGLVDWKAEVGDTWVIGIDTLVEGQSGGRIRPESLAFLGEALAGAGSRPVVVALHHPPMQTGIRFMDAIGLENIGALDVALAVETSEITILAGHVHSIHYGKLGRHRVATSPAICSAFSLDLRVNAPIGFMTGPTGCAILDTGPGGNWSAIPLDPSDGPFAF